MNQYIQNKKSEIIPIFLWLWFSFWYKRQAIFSLADSISVKLINKTISTRSIPFQIAFVSIFALLLSIFVYIHISKNKTIKHICVIASFVLFSILCAEQTLRRDDYWEIRDAYKYGFPGFILFEYLFINGRYFSLFLKSLYQFLPQVPYINTLLIFTQLLLWASCRLLLKHVFDEEKQSNLIIWGACLSFAMIFMSPNLWEVWFWGGGTLIYGIGIALAIMAAALMIDIELSANKKNLKTTAAVFCLFCACGTSELITASVCCFAFLIFVLPKILCGRKWNKRNGLLTAFSWTLTIIILLTSGNLRKASSLSGHQSTDILSLIRIFPRKVLEAGITLIQYGYSLLEFLLIFVFLAFLIGYHSPKLRISGKICVAAILSCILTGLGVLTINTMIDFTPARVISIPLDWICIALMLLMLFLGFSLKSRLNVYSNINTISVLVSFVLLTVTGIFFSNYYTTVRDIRTAWLQRDRELRAIQGSAEPVETCSIPVLGSSRADPGEDPKQDFNIVTAYYYGFPAITADHLCEPFENR